MHDSFICGTWLIYIWDMTHLYVRHESFTHATRIARQRNVCLIHHDSFTYMTHLCMGHDSFIRETWIIHNVTQIARHRNIYLIHHDSFICMIHSYVGHDSFWVIYTCDTNHSAQKSLCGYNTTYLYARLIYIWDMTHLNVGHESFTMWHKSFDTEMSAWIQRWIIYYTRKWHDSFIRGTWLIRTRDTIYLCVWQDSITCGIWLICKIKRLTWHRIVWLIQCGVMHRWHDSFICIYTKYKCVGDVVIYINIYIYIYSAE